MADHEYIEVRGDRQLEMALLALEGKITSLREPLLSAAEVLQHAAVGQFASEGAYLGTPWAPLETEYARRKAARWGPQPILVASGALKREVTSPRAIRKLTDSELLWGPTGRLAGWHQRGTEHMPARPLILVTPEIEQDVDRVFSAWIGEQMREVGL